MLPRVPHHIPQARDWTEQDSCSFAYPNEEVLKKLLQKSGCGFKLLKGV